MSGIEVDDGTINITYGNDANSNLLNAILSIRPVVSPNNDVVWLCGDFTGAGTSGLSDPSSGASGANATTIEGKYLPQSCRDDT